MTNASYKWLKVFLALGIKKLGSLIASIFGTRIDFLDLLFLDKFTIVSLVFLSLSSTISLLSTLNAFGANSHNLIVFNREINSAAILLKSLMKRQ